MDNGGKTMAMLGSRKGKILKNRNGSTSLNSISDNVDTSFLAETSLYCSSNQHNTKKDDSEDLNN